MSGDRDTIAEVVQDAAERLAGKLLVAIGPGKARPTGKRAFPFLPGHHGGARREGFHQLVKAQEPPDRRRAARVATVPEVQPSVLSEDIKKGHDGALSLGRSS